MATKTTKSINDNTVMCILLIVIALLIGGIAVYSISEINRINDRLDIVEGYMIEQINILEDRLDVLELQKEGSAFDG